MEAIRMLLYDLCISLKRRERESPARRQCAGGGRESAREKGGCALKLDVKYVYSNSYITPYLHIVACLSIAYLINL